MQRNRLTITLDSELLKGIDGLIDKEELRNRSQTIEHLLKEGIGLHQLKQVFLFISEDFSQSHLEAVVKLCSFTEIRQFFVCTPLALQSKVAEITAVINDIYQAKNLIPSIQAVPFDFGSGGALILQKHLLTTPFFLAWIKEPLPLPQNLISPYLFHRRHHPTLTQLLFTSDGATYTSNKLAIAQPELLSSIPAGISQIEETVFPELVKDDKVRAYPFAI